MKIDIHTHTKKCKSGDAPSREITPADFCSTLLSTDVRIIAITNHNVFDLEQYREIVAGIGQEVQVWPGIELDVLEDGSRGHLLVIVSPSQAANFSKGVELIIQGTTPDSFTATIAQVLAQFDSFGPLYVAHYRQKKPNLSDEALEKLENGTKHRSRVIKEVTNSISAGIYISHGHASMYGSDLQDWASYQDVAQDLPELRLPVESFEHFCLLLDKDPTTINTVLDKKVSEDVVLFPFDDGSLLKVKVYNDINVVFGPKGTGKSCILKAIAKHYSSNGIETKVYESASDRLDEIFDRKGKELAVNLNTYDISYCNDEIEALKTCGEVGVTNLSKYVIFFASKTTNRNAKKILLKDIEPEEEGGPRREFQEFNEAVQTTSEFLAFLGRSQAVGKVLSAEELEQVQKLLGGLHLRLRSKEWGEFSGWKEVRLLNSAIECVRREVERKTGSPSKPLTTGFREYALNRIAIEINAVTILKSVEAKIPLQAEEVGNLGSDKGRLEFRTELKFQKGGDADSSYSSLTGVRKGTQKSFVKQVRLILAKVYADDLFQHVAALNSIEEIEGVKTVYELLLFKRYFALNGVAYSPSSGEASMVMLQKELWADKEVYILDEPERSLGNEYINDVIVPLIKERARAGKRVFISTHDANIAVRTLPYSSIYRCHGPNGYTTYVGNPFSNSLVNLVDKDDLLNWKKVSMRTLEGGEEAFGERGKIYGSGN